MGSSTRIAKRLLVVGVLLAGSGGGAWAVHAGPAAPFPPAGSRILLETKDGTRVDGRVITIDGDSVRVLREGGVTSVAIDALAGAWERKGGAIGGLKAGMMFGVGVGLLEGFGTPGACIDCEDERGSAEAVLGAVAGEVVFFGLAGFLSGVLGGRWQAVTVPGHPAASGTLPPFPRYGASFGIGLTNAFEDDDGSTWGASLAGWDNSGETRSWGMEFGILDFAQREEFHYATTLGHYVPNDSSFTWTTSPGTVRDVRDEGWVYLLPLVFRMRGGTGTTRGFGELGAGAYAQEVAYNLEVRDSTGALVRRSVDSNVYGGFGLSAGGGIAFGRGEFRPAVRARSHWVITGQKPEIAVTGQVGLEFR